jgi:hypothetical protein
VLRDVQPGAAVNCTDMPLGTVERLLTDRRTREPIGLVVRRGRADHLLRLPARLVAEADRDFVRLSVRFEDVETAAAVDDDVPPSSENVREGAATTKTPPDEAVLGRPRGEPPRSPATG